MDVGSREYQLPLSVVRRSKGAMFFWWQSSATILESFLGVPRRLLRLWEMSLGGI